MVNKKKVFIQDHPYFGMRANEKKSVKEMMQQLRGDRYKFSFKLRRLKKTIQSANSV